MRNLIIPSIIAKNQRELDKRINKVKDHFRSFQLDVMDGKFVKNQSLNFDFTLPKGKRKYEAHLMVKSPKFWIKNNGTKVDTIIFHFESVKGLVKAKKLIKLIRLINKKVGVAINPRTSIEKIEPLLKEIDMVLVMTVQPGSYGAKFLPSTLKKIKSLRILNPNLIIEVDGGINANTIREAKIWDANFFVIGSYLQKSRNIEVSKKKLKSLMKGGGK